MCPNLCGSAALRMKGLITRADPGWIPAVLGQGMRDARLTSSEVPEFGRLCLLLAAEGVSHTEIAERMQVSRQTVITWRGRYERSGLAGLADQRRSCRSGRPRTVDRAAIITATLQPPPKKLGVTHWSSQLLADRLKVDHVTVARAWAEYGVAPWRCEFSTDPEMVAEVTDVVGLYLAPLENAIVLRIDEKSRDPGIGPRRRCRCSPGVRRAGLTTTAATAPPPCSRPWRSLPARSPRGV